jgi:hypothetical protein
VKRWVPLALCGLVGCLTPAAPARLLPDGTYRHDVRVEARDLPPQEFHGVLRKIGDRLSLVLLTPFDTTLVRITDAVASDEPQVEAYADEMREQRQRIEQLYLGLKPALVDLEATRTQAFGRDGKVARSGLDDRGVPRETRIDGDGFHIIVTVSHYEEAGHP